MLYYRSRSFSMIAARVCMMLRFCFYLCIIYEPPTVCECLRGTTEP